MSQHWPGHVIFILCISLITFPALAQELSVDLTSEPATVFNWESQHCDDNDIPDSPIRAVRLADGRVLALDSHFETRRFLGADLDTIKRDCTIVHRS